MKKIHEIKYLFYLTIIFCIGTTLSGCLLDGHFLNSNYLSKEELKEFTLAAVRGDGKAAHKVGDYYEFCTDDREKALFWFIIGTENNYLNSQNNVFIHLNDPYSTRCIFWLYKWIIANEDSIYRDNRIKFLNEHGYTLETARPPDDSLFTYDYASLPETEFAEYREGALLGSGQAALVLAQYYREIAHDLASSEYWFQIGAQNGNRECKYQFGNLLLGKKAMLDKERGKFWHDLPEYYSTVKILFLTALASL